MAAQKVLPKAALKADPTVSQKGDCSADKLDEQTAGHWEVLTVGYLADPTVAQTAGY